MFYFCLPFHPNMAVTYSNKVFIINIDTGHTEVTKRLPYSTSPVQQ